MTQKTMAGIDLLIELYSYIYYQRNGMKKRFTKSDAIETAVNQTVRTVIAEIKKVAEQGE